MVFVLIQTILLAGLAGAFLWNGGPAALPTTAWAGLTGWILTGAGVAVVAAAGLSLRGAVRAVPQPRAGARLVERGVYAYLRHPMYTSALLAATGLFLIRPRLPVALAAASVIAFYLIKARYEERLLLEHYPGYAAYRARTRGVLLLRGRQ